MRVVAFDIWGDYAHFRRFFTTVSPLTFSFPPPTAVRGLVGAILGFGKNEYIQQTMDLYIGVRVLTPIKRVWLGLNLVFTKGVNGSFEPTLLWARKHGGQPPRTQVKGEYLRNPRFRVYISGPAMILTQLEDRLKEHMTHFSPSLGLSELLADFEYVGTYEATPLLPGIYPMTSVFPVDIAESFPNLMPNIHLVKERAPIYLDVDRTPLLFQDVLVELQGKPVQVKVRNAHGLESGEVIYLWPPASTHIRACSSKTMSTAPSA